jgi:hypothetical protein
MSLKFSNLYLNTLLGGLVVLLTFVLILQYLMQSSNVLANRNTSKVQLTAPSNTDIQGIENKIGALENLIRKEEVRAREQQIAHDQQMDRLKIQITELEIQLEKSKVVEQKVQEQLELEKSLAEQLAQ